MRNAVHTASKTMQTRGSSAFTIYFPYLFFFAMLINFLGSGVEPTAAIASITA